jgi:flagellar hook-length control protein FliK
MAQDRLSSEALAGIGSELRTLSSLGGGEMRIRLRPEHLGELQVKVQSKGNEISLDIIASDDRAKKVIEDSVGFLRDSLMGQNLSVNRIDLSVAATPSSQQNGMDWNSNQQQQAQWAQGGLDQGSQGNQRGQNSNESSQSDGLGLSRRSSGRVSAFQGSAPQSAQRAAAGRLDVMA